MSEGMREGGGESVRGTCVREGRVRVRKEEV